MLSKGLGRRPRGVTGKDKIYGGEGDYLNGGRNGDLLDGGPGADYFHAGPGDDTIMGGPGNDEVASCSSGEDTVYLYGEQDRFYESQGCEHIIR